MEMLYGTLKRDAHPINHFIRVKVDLGPLLGILPLIGDVNNIPDFWNFCIS